MNRRAGLVGAVVCLGLLATVRGGGGGPPLYDGVCLPPQYTMLGANPPPPSLSSTLSPDVLASTFERADNDTSPQAQIIVAAGSLVAPPGAATATLTITPVKPPAVKPGDGTIDGNVYDFEVTAGGKQLQVAPNHLVTIVLTATASGGAQRQVEHFDGTRWTPAAKTVQSGCGTTYQANSTTLGIFALVAQGAAATPSGPGGGGSGGGSPILIVIVVVLVVLAIIIGAVRMSRQRGRRGKRRR
jgi:hypothetical protein